MIQHGKSSGSWCSHRDPKSGARPRNTSTSFDPKPMPFVERQFTFLEGFNVAGNTFGVGSRQHRRDQCCGCRVSVLACVHAKTQQIPVWPFSQPLMNPFKACTQL